MAPDEAARRLTRDGPNLLASAPKTGVLQRFAGQFRSPLIYLLLAAAAVATVLADWVDAAFIMGVLLINAMIGTVQETRADASAEALSRMIRQTARVRRGELIDVDAQGVVLGDIVEVETGMQVAADLRLIASRGLTADESHRVVEGLRQRPTDWVKFMMRFELGLETPEPGRAWRSALTIAGAYVVGGFVPLSAYWLVPHDVQGALRLSAVVTLLALALFGGLKGRFTGAGMLKSAVQTTMIGGLAAAAAFGLARWLS